MSWLSELGSGYGEFLGGFSDLFQQTTPEVETWNQWDTGQQALAGQLGPYLQGMMGQGATPVPWALTPQYNPLLGDAWSAYGGMGASPSFTSQSNAFRQALSGQPSFQYNPQQSQQIFQEGMRPATYAFQNALTDVTEQVKGITGEGLRGSGLNRALSESARGYGESLAGMRAQQMATDQQRQFQAGETAAQRSLQASLAQTPEQRLAAMQEAAGWREYQAAFQALQAQTQEFIRTQPEYSPWMNYMLSFLGMMPITGTGLGGMESQFAEVGDTAADLYQAFQQE